MLDFDLPSLLTLGLALFLQTADCSTLTMGWPEQYVQLALLS